MLLKIGIMPVDTARLLLERACPEMSGGWGEAFI